jgi:methyl-accepting chemotaxis protein
MEAPMRQPESRPAQGVFDFFAHHGVWAPGVRLFRKVNFTTKALFVSLAFMVPITLLLVAYLQTIQESLNFTSDERAGVKMLLQVEPWTIEVQKQRRLVMSGMARGVDLDAINARLAPVKSVFDAKPGGIDGSAALEKALVAHKALVAAAQGANDAAHVSEPLQAYVEATRALRNTVLDLSNLSLDPEQATYYVMSVSTTVLSDVVESVSRSRALAGSSRDGAQTAQQSRLLYAIWYDGQQLIDSISDQVARAALADPSVTARLPVAATLAATKEFYAASEKRWFGDTFSAGTDSLNAPGQAAVDALRKSSADGVRLLDELLEARSTKATHLRNLTIAIVVVSLATVMYLFYCFFLVMSGGLSEVERHLRAMTDGDLTTSPRPWGKDEAARLMTTLADMQGALRSIVSDVRGASDGLVNASNEIATASSDLSARSEQAAASLEESASAMEEISQTVQHTADSTRSAADIATNNALVAAAGGKTIAEVISTMSGVKASSSKIADIIGIIDGIAFQTNILALNAAVEAARAGEQGRGFAVVASEVRSLAQRSAAAAKEIKGLITDSGERVDTGSRVVVQAGAQMGEMVSTAEQMKSLMLQVLTGTSEQSAGIKMVGDSLQTLDQQTQANAALVEETAAAASSLHDQAIALSERVARFKLPA